MSQDGRAIANFILDMCDREGRPISNLPLQKILYFCHVWFLIEAKEPLVKQQFEAWQFGPVLQYVYREFRDFDGAPISSRAFSLDVATGQRKIAKYSFHPSMEDLLTRVVSFYSRMSPGELVRLSHVEGGPWDVVWNHGGSANPGMKIDNENIKRFYGRVRAPFEIQ